MKVSVKKAVLAVYMCITIGIISGVVLSYICPVFRTDNIDNSDSGSVAVNESKLTFILKYINRHYIDSVDTKGLEELAILHVVNGLDAHSTYIAPYKKAGNSVECSEPIERGGVDIYLANSDSEQL